MHNIIFKAQSEAQYLSVLAKLKANNYYLSFNQKKLNSLAKSYKSVYMNISKQGEWVLYDNASMIKCIHGYYYDFISDEELTLAQNEQALYKLLNIN